MATYAILGSTGQVGGSILGVLLQTPDSKIRCYARSKSKLLSMRPELESSANVSIFEGSIGNIQTIIECIAGTRAVFLAVALSDNVPGCDIAQKTAKSVVEALSQLRKQESHVPLPQLVILSSASLEPNLMQDVPAIGQTVMKMAASHIYDDLRKAETFLRSHDWIKQVYIKPGGLVHDKQRGHALSTERQQTFLSFLDLAAGMVEVADADSDRWDMKNVSVIPASSGTRIEWRIPLFLFRGLMWHFFPFLYPSLSGWLPG